jgi:hypothetical protein
MAPFVIAGSGTESLAIETTAIAEHLMAPSEAQSLALRRFMAVMEVNGPKWHGDQRHRC